MTGSTSDLCSTRGIADARDEEQSPFEGPRDFFARPRPAEILASSWQGEGAGPDDLVVSGHCQPDGSREVGGEGSDSAGAGSWNASNAKAIAVCRQKNNEQPDAHYVQGGGNRQAKYGIS